MIRTEFFNVVLCDDLQEGIVNVDDENLLLFEIMILFDKFLSVHIILPFAISIFCIKIKIVHR